jgi:hypothetical protein
MVAGRLDAVGDFLCRNRTRKPGVNTPATALD